MQSINRRDFLKFMGAGTIALNSDAIFQALRELPPSLRSPAALAQPLDDVQVLINRITFGPRPGLVAAVREQGITAYLDQQLNPSAIDDAATEVRLSAFPTLTQSIAEMLAADVKPGQAVIALDIATIIRAIYSERQLLEVMVGFWSDHFSIYHLKQGCTLLKTVDDREVIHKYALGTFRQLLGASASSPAMLVYLDNAESRKEHPNENYARELLELHTMGVRSGYTEMDVKEIARCFTGWTGRGRNQQQPGTFVFRAAWHDDGEKTVLGQTIPAGGGRADGERVLDILAAHPATATFIATKLCRRFISDQPDPAVVEAVAKAFRDSQGDIPTVLRALFSLPAFFQAPPKFKRPFEYFVGIARALDLEPRAALKPGLLEPLKMMGHLPFDWAAPNGYPDIGAYWQSNMLLRWNVALAAAYGGLPGLRTDLGKLASTLGLSLSESPKAIVNSVGSYLLGRPLTDLELETLWQFGLKQGGLQSVTPESAKILTDIIGLIIASPAYQYR